MPLSGLSVATELALGSHYPAPHRRAPPDRSPPRPAEATASGSPVTAGDTAVDAALYAGRFKANLAELRLSPEGGVCADRHAPADEADQALFDFFGNLSVLLIAVRAGDLAQARAAADALEMEVLIERSAGRRVLVGAPQSDGGSARAAPSSALPDAGSAYETLAALVDSEAPAT